MAKVHERSQKISADGRASNERWLRSLPGCSLIFGHGRLEGPNSVRVGDELLVAPRIFLNVGGRALIPRMPGGDKASLLTNSSLLDLATLPDHLVVVGGSYIGLEFGQAYRRFGANVTIIERGSRLIGREDETVSEAVRGFLEAEGIIVRTGAECIRFAPRSDGIRVGIGEAHGASEIVGSHVLIAVGRVPNTGDLGLDKAGVEMDAHGYISVDDRLQTNVPGIWALGDCNGRGAFTHTSYNDFEIVAENLLDGADRRVSDRIPCYALFTDPPLGRVGLSAGQARAAGRRGQDRPQGDDQRRPCCREGRADRLHGNRG